MPIKLPIIPQMVGIADSFRMSIMLFHLLSEETDRLYERCIRQLSKEF